MKRLLNLVLMLPIAACAPQYTETFVTPDAPLPVNEARFSDAPDALHTAFRDACTDPGDTYAAIGRTGARCTFVPPPDVAAALLLRFDSAIELPFIVIERQTRSEDDGYVVSISYFATVPLKSGNQQRVYLRSRDIDRSIDELFLKLGGTPI